MTKRKKGSGSSDFKVGYGRPPEATRFKPGTSGNPRGGSKTRKETEAAITTVLEENHMVVERGKKRRMSTLEIILRRHKTSAMDGDVKASRLLLDERDKHKKPAASDPTTEYDLSVLDEEELSTLETILTKAAKAKTEEPGPKDE